MTRHLKTPSLNPKIISNKRIILLHTVIFQQTTMSRRRNNNRHSESSEIDQLRETVRTLQKDAQDQLSLEMESQASFEHIYSQVKGLRNAFDTLSDVLLEEVDSLRAETSKRFDGLNLQMEKQDRVLENACQDLGVLKRTIDVWGVGF